MKMFKWTVMAVDNIAKSMTVQYELNGDKMLLNLPLPNTGVDIEEHVQLYAPRHTWEQKQNVQDVVIGRSGLGNIEQEASTEQPNTAGSFDEEYLRAMIYQVLEEVRASEA